MAKFRTVKNSYLKLRQNFTHTITQEEARERYFTKMLDEAIESFEKNPVTISLEEWREHMRRDFNIVL